MVWSVNSVSQILMAHQAWVKQLGVKSLAVFGSFARGEATANSYIDGLDEFNQPVGLFEFIRLKYYLQELTKRRIDLVTPDALRPCRPESILSEVVLVAWKKLENSPGRYADLYCEE